MEICPLLFFIKRLTMDQKTVLILDMIFGPSDLINDNGYNK